MEILIWPGVVTVLGIVAIISVRKSLVGFINRSTGFRFGKTQVDAPLPHQAPQSRSMLPTGDSKTARPEPLETGFGQAIVKETETEIHDYMEKRVLPENLWVLLCVAAAA